MMKISIKNYKINENTLMTTLNNKMLKVLNMEKSHKQ
jgi:hypothetical protein